VNAGDTAWVLVSAALVLFMTPGLALFYGGMVQAKNVLGVIMQNFLCMDLATVLWAVVAASYCFCATWAVAKAVDAVVGLRVGPEEEFTGLDLTQHAESAYSMGGTGRIGG